MVESILVKKGFSFKAKMTVKALISLGIIALAVVLPQVAHLAVGAQSGVKWLPMYLPVLLGGCLLGVRWGVAVGIASPVVSFLITSALGNPMPAAARLPFMALELAVFALVSGLFAKKISENALFAFPAVILAELCGRSIFLLAVYLFGASTPFTVPMIFGQIVTGIPGLILNAAVVPVIALCVRYLSNRKTNND